jgi:hypothetical protein
MQRQRVVGDYLQPAAIFDEHFHVHSALTDPNNYQGPGTGYRLSDDRWAALQRLPQVQDPRRYAAALGSGGSTGFLHESGPAAPGTGLEIVIAVGPAFGAQIQRTLADLDHRDVLEAMLMGSADEGVSARIVRVHHTADCAFIGHTGAQLSGSGVAIGIQSKGTAVIHQCDLPPLENLELFSMSPNMTLENYRDVGRNAARYAAQRPTSPVPVHIDNTARLRLIVQTMLMHLRETRQVRPDKLPTELQLA